jgi:cytochrome P450
MGEASKIFPPNTHPQNLITYLTRKYSLPEIFYLDLWPLAPSQMVIVSGEAAAQISTVRPYPINRYINELLTPVLGAHSIATSNGNLWKKLHHMIGPALMPRYTKTLLGSTVDETLIFHDRLKILADKEVFPMEEELSRLLFDIIGKIVFGFPLNAQKAGSPILTDLKYSLESFSLTFRTWNYIKKQWVLLKQKAAGDRIDAYIGANAKRRFAILRDEKEPATSRKASSILDRILLDKIEASNVNLDDKEELDAEYLQLIADKYVCCPILPFPG